MDREPVVDGRAAVKAGGRPRAAGRAALLAALQSWGVVWILAYYLVVAAPLLLMAIRPVPPGRTFWVEASVALGFVGLLQIGVQFALVARFQAVTAPYGIDAVLRFHRNVAVVALVFLVAHPLILALRDPALWALLDPFGGTWTSRTGNGALYALLLLTVLSLFRRPLRLGYEAWRVSHALLGIAAIVLAHVHVHLVGHYAGAVWKEATLVAVSTALVGTFGYLRLVKPVLLRRRRYRVTEVRRERGGVWELALRPEGHEGMAFLPGQFAYLKLGEGPYAFDEHPFSFASSAETPERLTFAIKELGDFSRRIGEVPSGAVAFVDGPHGSFSTDLAPAPGYVFVAGGIGIAPFVSMLRTLADRGDPRPILLFYGERRWEDVAFREELDRLATRLRLEVVHALEEPPAGWTGETGFVDEGMLRRRLPTEGFERAVLVCGPNPMIRAVERALLRLGIDRGRIHAERFELA